MNTAIILAGGTGSRLGEDTPKQYLKVKNRMIITYCLETFFTSKYIEGVMIVADPVWHETILTEINALISKLQKKSSCKCVFLGFALPGKNRQLSIYNALAELKKNPETAGAVIIHDAARPLVSAELIEKSFKAYEGHDGVMPVLPMKDTVYMSEDGRRVTRLLKRETLFAGQSPEIFNLDKYYQATKDLLPDKVLSINGSSEPAVMAGMDIAVVDGDELNFKITTKMDLERFERIVCEDGRVTK